MKGESPSVSELKWWIDLIQLSQTVACYGIAAGGGTGVASMQIW